jgi:hypothetical protein
MIANYCSFSKIFMKDFRGKLNLWFWELNEGFESGYKYIDSEGLLISDYLVDCNGGGDYHDKWLSGCLVGSWTFPWIC